MSASLPAEIKQAVKDGQLPKAKYSVRIQRFSGGRSIDVTVKDYAGTIHNRRHLELDHQIGKGAAALGRATYRDLYGEREQTPRHTEDARELIKALEQMVDQWNYDGSETQVDYFQVNYYSHVQFDSDQSHEEWQEMMADIKAHDHGLRIFNPERQAV